MALFADGRKKSRVLVNSLFRAPGNNTLLPSQLNIRIVTYSTYLSAFGVEATVRCACQFGKILNVLREPLAKADGVLKASQRNRRDPKRKDIVESLPNLTRDPQPLRSGEACKYLGTVGVGSASPTSVYLK